jgi:hypothetical protein
MAIYLSTFSSCEHVLDADLLCEEALHSCLEALGNNFSDLMRRGRKKRGDFFE